MYVSSLTVAKITKIAYKFFSFMEKHKMAGINQVQKGMKLIYAFNLTSDSGLWLLCLIDKLTAIK